MTKQFIALFSERDMVLLRTMLPSVMFSEVAGVTLSGNEGFTLIASVTKPENSPEKINDPVEPLPQN